MGCYCLILPQASSFWLANATKRLGCYLISYYLRVAFLYSAWCASCSSQKHKTSSAPAWEKKGCIIQPRAHWATDPLPSVARPYLDTDVYDFLLNLLSKGKKKGKKKKKENCYFLTLSGGDKLTLLSGWYLGRTEIESLHAAATLVFSTPHRGAACSRARHLDSQDGLQITGAVGARALQYINTAVRKERVPLPWQDFLGYVYLFGRHWEYSLKRTVRNFCYLVFFSLHN